MVSEPGLRYVQSSILIFVFFFCMFAYSYGLKTVNGVNRLSGEGLEAKDYPGMMQGGGKWPGR